MSKSQPGTVFCGCSHQFTLDNGNWPDVVKENHTEVTRLLLISDESLALNQFSTLSSAADFQVQHRSKTADARGALLAGAFDLCVFAPSRMTVELANELIGTRALVPRLQIAVILPAGESSETQQKLLAAGANLVRWNGRDERGRAVTPGVYFYRLASAGQTTSGKVVLVK